MANRGCLWCLKCFVLICNILIWLCGLAFLLGSIYLLMDPLCNSIILTSYGDEMYYCFRIGCYLIMAFSIIFTLLAFLGCAGVYHESKKMLCMFCTLFIIIVGLESGAGIMTYFQKDKLENNVVENIGLYINKKYGSDPFINHPIDNIQSKLKCCGGSDYRDWENSKWENMSSNHFRNVPSSCCLTLQSIHKTTNHWTTKNYNSCPAANQDALFLEGCGQIILSFITDGLFISAITIISMIAVQLLSILFSMIMCCCLVRKSAGGYKK